LAYSNILETIPVSLFALKNLAELDLSNNVLCSIPDALGSELTNLTHLVLRNNMLTDTDFPKNLSGLARSLKFLNLSGNNLTSIPPPLLQLTGIQTKKGFEQ
jgi:Leucine-rich repeat (LRR) protein